MFAAIKLFLAPVWAFLKSLPWWVYAVTALLAAAYFYGESRYKSGQAERQGAWDYANTIAEQNNRKREEGWRKGIADYATQETQKRLIREREFSAIVDGLQSGTGPVRVRPRLKCPVPQATGTTSGNDGGPAGSQQPDGFQESDAVVVLRIGEDADAVASRLAQCQNYVRTVAGSSGGSR